MGIELITTSVSQAKGRIERLWGTLQSRLVSELRIRGITTIHAANRYLPEFTADFNGRFASEPNMEGSLFAPPPSEREIDFYPSAQYRRISDIGSCFLLFGRKVMLFDKEMSPVRVPPKTTLDFYATRSGKVVAFYSGSIYEVLDAPENEGAVPKKESREAKMGPAGKSPMEKVRR